MRRKIGERVVAIARADEETVPPGRKVQAIGYVEAEGSIGILFDFHGSGGSWPSDPSEPFF